MSPFELYREFSSTWDRLRSDILAHLVLAGILYVCGYRLPDLSAMGLDPARLLDSTWQEFLGSVGLPLTLAAIVALALVIYTSLLSGIGSAGAQTLDRLLDHKPFTVFDGQARHNLTIVAASLPKDQLNAHTLRIVAHGLMQEVSTNPPESVSWIRHNSEQVGERWTLFRDACFFPVAWLLLPLVGLPPNVWTAGDGAPVLAFILMCVFAALTRNLLTLSHNQFARYQLDAAAHVLEVGERKQELWERLKSNGPTIEEVVKELIKEEQRWHRKRRLPSLRRYLGHRYQRARRCSIKVRAHRMNVRCAWRKFEQQALTFEYSRSGDYANAEWLESYARWRAVKLVRAFLRFWHRLRY